MLEPELVAEFVRTFADEVAAIQREATAAAWSDVFRVLLHYLKHRNGEVGPSLGDAAAPLPLPATPQHRGAPPRD